MIEFNERVDKTENGRHVVYNEYKCGRLDMITLIRYGHLGSFADRKALVKRMMRGATTGWFQTDGTHVIATFMHSYEHGANWNRPTQFMYRIYEVDTIVSTR